MEIFIQSIDPVAWNAIVKGPFIPTKEVNGDVVNTICYTRVLIRLII